jgi:hypothetical protein
MGAVYRATDTIYQVGPRICGPREMRSHPARRDPGAAEPAAQHSLARWAATLGLRVPPSSVPVLGGCRPLRTYREVGAHIAQVNRAPQPQPHLIRGPRKPKPAFPSCWRAPGSIARGLRGVWVRAIWLAQPCARPEWEFALNLHTSPNLARWAPRPFWTVSHFPVCWPVGSTERQRGVPEAGLAVERVGQRARARR